MNGAVYASRMSLRDGVHRTPETGDDFAGSGFWIPNGFIGRRRPRRGRSEGLVLLIREFTPSGAEGSPPRRAEFAERRGLRDKKMNRPRGGTAAPRCSSSQRSLRLCGEILQW